MPQPGDAAEEQGVSDLYIMAIPSEMYARVHSVAVRRGETVTDTVARALREFLAREGEGNGKRQLLTEAPGR